MSAPIVERLQAALPLLEELETGQECAEYAYAKGKGFQAMTYCPEAFEALRSIPEAADTIEGLLAAFEHISSSYENQDISHLVFRVNAKNIADAAIAKTKGGAA